MDKEIQKIPKRSLGIRLLSMGAPLPGYAAPMRQNDPSSMKRHLPPLKTIKILANGKDIKRTAACQQHAGCMSISDIIFDV